MRQESIFDSIKDVAFDEPGLYSSIQKALSKVNEKRGSKYTTLHKIYEMAGVAF